MNNTSILAGLAAGTIGLASAGAEPSGKTMELSRHPAGRCWLAGSGLHGE
jgi:hypothetical protein